MGEQVRLTAEDGFELGAYRADPGGGPRGAVVVVGEVWGVNRWVRSVADLYAGHGYLAVAPALFDRAEPGFESEDYSPAHFERIGGMLGGFDVEAGLLDLAAAVRYAAEAGAVGITGFCFGGAMTWRAAGRVDGLAAASGFYGGGVPRYVDVAPVVPTQMHYASRDHGIPVEQVEDLQRRHPQVEVFTYDADHGFCNSDGDRYDEAACRLATDRTLAHFAQHLA